MSATTIACDHAIFTSIRTPMGEGYRIIAASGGLHADEKQVITRFTPSHEGLCHPSTAPTGRLPEVAAVAFYALPSNRLCIGLSCLAGAEHTGRGGQRVYTHNAVLTDADFAACEYNPFNIVRAMAAAGLASAQLKPPTVLPTLELTVAGLSGMSDQPGFHRALNSEYRRYFLRQLMDGRCLIVNVDGDWVSTAEALLLGIPGPLRTKLSFGAGLRFSIGRRHDLHLLYDDKDQTRIRVTGQPVEYIDPAETRVPAVANAAWSSFVDRHWSAGNIATLARRTSRAFTDPGPGGRERVGRLYNSIDDIPQADCGRLLGQAAECLDQPVDASEQDIVAEFLDASQRALLDKLSHCTLVDAKRYWPAILNIWRRSDRGLAFARPMIEAVLRRVRSEDPIVAAELALDAARDVPAAGMDQAHVTVLDDMLAHLANWADQVADVGLERFARVCEHWRRVRPECPIVDRLQRRARELLDAHAATHLCPHLSRGD